MDVIGSDSFSEKLAERLEARHIKVERRLFPDGEVCPRLLASPGNDVLLAERLSLPLSPNRYLAEVLLIIKNLQAMKVENISMVMPYYVYSRQDRSFRPGEPFSAKHVLELLADSGVKRFFTVSSHIERFKSQLTAPMPAFNLDGYSILGEHMKGLNLNQPIVMGPDMTISMAAERVASMLGAENLSIEKTRDVDTGRLTVESVNKDFKGRDVVIVDDIISTGGTMLNAIKVAEDCYCGKVVIAAVHAVQQKGIDLLKKHAWRVFATDTINTPISEISVIDKVAESVKSEGIGASIQGAESIEQEGKKQEPHADDDYTEISESKDSEASPKPEDSADQEPAEGAFSMFD